MKGFRIIIKIRKNWKGSARAPPGSLLSLSLRGASSRSRSWCWPLFCGSCPVPFHCSFWGLFSVSAPSVVRAETGPVVLALCGPKASLGSVSFPEWMNEWSCKGIQGSTLHCGFWLLVPVILQWRHKTNPRTCFIISCGHLPLELNKSSNINRDYRMVQSVSDRSPFRRVAGN